jgi:hypothetical protein
VGSGSDLTDPTTAYWLHEATRVVSILETSDPARLLRLLAGRPPCARRGTVLRTAFSSGDQSPGVARPTSASARMRIPFGRPSEDGAPVATTVISLPR